MVKKMKFKQIRTIFLVVILVAVASYAYAIQFKCAECHESPQEVFPAKHVKLKNFDSCFNCHKDGKVKRLNEKVHAVHLADSGYDVDTCTSCHIASTDGAITVNSSTGQIAYADEAAAVTKSFYTAGKLANSHKNAGLTCTSCHTTFDYDEFDSMSKKCIECHGDYPEVAKRTANTKFDTNPHKSHYSALACNKCHSMHGEFQDYCSVKCHKWGFEWKQKIKPQK
jgi:uncharacterized protein with PIN domain